MKGSDTWWMHNVINRIELHELKRALQAHNGHYTFEHIVLVASEDVGDEWENYEITEALLNEDGRVEIYGKREFTDDEVVKLNFVHSDEFAVLTDAIEPTKEVQDVSDPEYVRNALQGILK